MTGNKSKPGVRLERLPPERIEELFNSWADEDKYPIPKDATPEERKKAVRHIHKVVGWILCLRSDHVLLAIDNTTDRVVGSADWFIVNPEIQKQLWRPGMPKQCVTPRPPILLNDEGDILEIHELTIEDKDWSTSEDRSRVESVLLDEIVRIATDDGRKLVRWYVSEEAVQWVVRSGFTQRDEPVKGLWLMTKEL